MLQQKELNQLADRIDKIVDEVGELSIQADREHGEESKAAYRMCDALTGLKNAYEALVGV